MIAFESVSKSFDNGHSWAVKDVSLTVNRGETLALLGSSGSGKTTLLKTVNRLLDPTRGTVRLGEQCVTKLDPVQLRRRVGYVFQGVGLFPHQRVRRNVETVPRLLRWPRNERRARVDMLLRMVGLAPETYATRFPDELSGGQRQRVGFARALAADPDVLLMDEPFGALDEVVRQRLQQKLAALIKELGKTVLLVTHDLFEALALADRVAVLHNGVLEQVATPRELLKNPKTDFVRQLVERPARLLGVGGEAAERPPAPVSQTWGDSLILNVEQA